ncbi:hypothetical protein [Bacillus sp. T33-2]|uniref:hypothetical protein n=1 Tax=Bacillus sp. T33-2 TaxID=2054168 RepID=UPI000C75F4B5|nr:hypothetical protein [Bacillus sp. T33-2]PLR99589.1 hypothetical protein CVD19_00570 [Bacillus sp. T33-2]
MDISPIIETLKARATTIRDTINLRQTTEPDESSWKYSTTEELYGRLLEIQNTLAMLEKLS